MQRVKLDKCSKVLRVLLTFSMKSKSLQKGTIFKFKIVWIKTYLNKTLLLIIFLNLESYCFSEFINNGDDPVLNNVNEKNEDKR